MTPVHTLPYDLSSLTWNDDHTNNDQDKYCYCGKGYSEHKTMMQCSTCLQFFHSACVSSVKRPLLYGDIFYEFQCSVCTQAEEKYTREVMKWKQAVQLILYHLTKQRRLSKGKQPEHFYFRFTEEICKLVEENWDVLLWDREMNKTWKNTVASSLSTQPDLFLSGVTKWDSAGKGLWALRSEEPLSKLSSARQAPKTETTKRLKKRKPAKDELQSKKRTRSSRYDHSPVTSPEHNQETTNNDDSGSIMKDTLPTMDKENTNAALDDGALGTTTKSDDSTSDKMKTADEAIVTTKRTIVSSDDLENVADSTTDFKVDDSTVNLMKTDSQPKTLKNTLPKNEVPTLAPMSQHDEWQIYQTLDHAHKKLSNMAARFRRKLAVRRLKRNVNLKLFDIDQYVGQQLRSKISMQPMTKQKRSLITPSEQLRSSEIIAAAAAAEASIRQLKLTKYDHSFASRLYGRQRHSHTLTSDECWLSAWNGRKLRPYIRRDYENKPARMRLLEQIKEINGKPSNRHLINAREAQQDDDESSNNNKTSIDYVYFQREHLEQVNQLLARCFWDGVDVSESLQFPEFSVVALYKRCVIGCAFMTPEAYITYFAVMAGWERAGIGQFMLYHLFQTALSKDVTLHVSANNNAMILYQKFGFKPEEFIVNFYDKYLPAESSFSKNAFFLRLRR